MKVKNFDDVIFGRKSIKIFDENFKIPKNEMMEIIEKATKAPSSVNMQPWRFLVVESKEGKDKLQPLIRFNTRQNETSSAMIVVLGDMYNYEYGEKIYNSAVEFGYMPLDIKNNMLPSILEMYKSLDRNQMKDIVNIDSSLAAMQLMLVAKSYGYETNPIGGFEKDKIAETFDLDKERYIPVMIIAIGKGKQVAHESYRLPVGDIIEFK
ncbi:nitroreductase family protein [Mammaliicoccus sciuri]|uniref:nitroreductase family protein n=1 Tax=Mammaliicoccus sciuri TaxID=1296 RepID=UPI001E60E025|nr:nitroreductase family protein [Mammaliicoccus sciuri]MCD8875403.1 nitroreductase family protein [Mammaliicoccus sciuri]